MRAKALASRAKLQQVLEQDKLHQQREAYEDERRFLEPSPKPEPRPKLPKRVKIASESAIPPPQQVEKAIKTPTEPHDDELTTSSNRSSENLQSDTPNIPNAVFALPTEILRMSEFSLTFRESFDAHS